MKKNPFKVLGLNDSATQSEVNEAYYSLKGPYEEQRFFEGEVGDEACRKLTELKDAYDEASSIIASKYEISEDTDTLLREAEGLIKSDRLDDAQAKLNSIRTRNGRWHFLQAGIYYKKNWHSDAINELNIALSMEPNNSSYRATMDHVQKEMKGSTFNSQQNGNFYQNRQNGQTNGRSYYNANNPYNGARRGTSACDCCTSLICADCCCECMGGDLISCC